MRCLALAQAWQEADGQVNFVMGTEAPVLEARLNAENMPVAHVSTQLGGVDDVKQTLCLAQECGADWIVVDGYHFDANYQYSIKQAGRRLLVLDDYGHAAHYFADLVLNQNLSAAEALYVDRESHTQLLLGVRYALLRREFWPWRGWRRETPEVARKVLVTLGGSDPDNVTVKVLQALRQIDMGKLEVTVVVGPANQYLEILRQQILGAGDHLQLVTSATNMPELMAWADVAISAGGSTCWELAFMGLPTLIIVLADNQRSVAEGLNTAGAALNLGWHTDLSPADISTALSAMLAAEATRAQMMKQSQMLIDGLGASRAGERMRTYDPPILLRFAFEDDCQMIWELTNDPDVRAASFSPNPISWEDHVAWFHRKLKDPNHVFYIAMNANYMPVGQIRYDINGVEAVISVGLSPHFCGQGYGSKAISTASEQVLATTPARIVHAYIKAGNIASLRAFLRAGYKDEGLAIVHNRPAHHLVLQRLEL